MFNELRAQGKEPIGIRLDSGDLAYLSKTARKMLDAAGFPNTKIVASNDLDEDTIWHLKAQGAKIDLWGVGTALITSKGCPALGGVYKLSAEEIDGKLVPKIKISENPEKMTNPGYKKVVRLYEKSTDKAIADLIMLDEETIDETKPLEIFHPIETWKRMTLTDFYSKELLQPVFVNGKKVFKEIPLKEISAYSKNELSKFWDEYTRIIKPSEYKVDLSQKLYDMKTELLKDYASEKNR